MSGLKVGKSYTIKATWTGDGYVVDELQWMRPLSAATMNSSEPGRSRR
jgi:hypothetical protein